MDIETDFITTLLNDVRHKRLDMPMLPEVALRVRRIAADPKATAAHLARAIGIDATLSTRLLQVVNSPLYRARTPIDNIQSAITRLGGVLVRNLVTSLVMGHIFEQPRHPIVKKHLKAVWAHSIQVASISQVFARRFTRLSPDQALLAGLIHDVGKLPILTHMENFPALLKNELAMDSITAQLHPQIGRVILEVWRFPDTLVTVAAEHEDLGRNPHETQVDYADLVLVANLYTHSDAAERRQAAEGVDIPAMRRLGLTPQTTLAALGSAQEELLEVRKLLSG